MNNPTIVTCNVCGGLKSFTSEINSTVAYPYPGQTAINLAHYTATNPNAAQTFNLCPGHPKTALETMTEETN